MKGFLIATAIVAVAPSCFAEPPQVTREVLLDNDQVEVVRLTYPAGSESGMHTHEYPNRVVYVVKGGTLEMVSADSDQPPRTMPVADGQAGFVPAATHNVRNIGDTEVVLIETEIK